METLIKKSKKLLRAAKKVFGEELIVNAFIKSEYYSNYTLLSKSQTLSRDERSIRFKDDEFSYDYTTIQLELSNGRLIEFSNSEWAVIRLLKTN